MSVQNKVVIITGASSGIGAATARLLAKNGAKVVLAARREPQLQQLQQEITLCGGQAVYQVTDVRQPEHLQLLVDLAQQRFQAIDVIFNNAGIMPTSPISALKTKDWVDMIDINLKGVLNGIAAVMPIFTRQQSGHIITTCSIAGIRNYINCGVYGATKFAVHNLMEVIRQESVREGTNIRTTTLNPAAINTELLHSITDEAVLQSMTKLYQKVGISPDAIARVVNFAIEQPEDTNISELTIYPTKQA
ncbi:MAG: SDR family oxidoreductase [Snodgrassella sp.]|nr:SDR family oxidoreductase [Snodgrassella sp.]